MTEMDAPQLSRRETGKLELLEAIGAKPGRTKMAVVTNDGATRVPTKTRAGQYRMIDALIERCLVEAGYRSGQYHLAPTELGLAEIAFWDAA